MARKHKKSKKRASAKKGRTKVVPLQLFDSNEPFFWKANAIPALILFVVSFGLYAMSLNYGYVLDDVLVLSENTFVQKGFAGLGDIFANEGFTGFLGEQQDLVAGGRYRPLSLALFAIEGELFGFAPRIGHLFNVLWYAALILLIYRVLSIMIPNTKNTWWLSLPFIATLLYATHPIHSEAVANIKGRDEILTFFLSLLTLYASFRYVSSMKVLPLMLSGFCFLLALLAKENAITFLAVIPISLYLFTKARAGHIIRALLPLGVATIIYAIIRYQALGFLVDSGAEVTGLMNDPFRDMNGSQKYATIFHTLLKYIQLQIFPHPLTHDYYPYQVPITEWTDPRAFLSLLIHLALGIWTVIRLRKRGDVLSYAILFYLITLSITSNIVFTIGTFMNERFIFMPSLGFTLLLAWVLVQWLPSKVRFLGERRWITGILVLGILGGYGFKTIDRLPAWESGYTLNVEAAKISVNSARANNFRGYDLYLEATEQSDRQRKMELLGEAEVYIDKALSIHPTYPDAMRVKAGILGGRFTIDNDIDVLLDGFRRLLVVRHLPYIDSFMEYLNRRGSQPALIDFYHEVSMDVFLAQQRNAGLAYKYLQYGYSLAPNDVRILEDLCVVAYSLGRMNEARRYGRAALAIDPNRPTAKRYMELIRQ